MCEVKLKTILSVASISPSNVLGESKNGKGMSSDDFVQFMESLQTTKNVIMDPSRSVSTSTYAKITIRMFFELASCSFSV